MLCQASTKANCETQNSTKRHEGDKRPTDAEHVGVSEGKATKNIRPKSCDCPNMLRPTRTIDRWKSARKLYPLPCKPYQHRSIVDVATTSGRAAAESYKRYRTQISRHGHLEGSAGKEGVAEEENEETTMVGCTSTSRMPLSSCNIGANT